MVYSDKCKSKCNRHKTVYGGVAETCALHINSTAVIERFDVCLYHWRLFIIAVALYSFLLFIYTYKQKLNTNIG
jgi:hypothetical protein